MDDCPFCQIVKRELPAGVTYEDDRVIVFAPIHPITAGHILVAPKGHYEGLAEIPVELLSNIMVVAKSLSIVLLEKHGATGINLLHATGRDAQQSVFHFHVHLVPRYPKDGLDLWFVQ